MLNRESWLGVIRREGMADSWPFDYLLVAFISHHPEVGHSVCRWFPQLSDVQFESLAQAQLIPPSLGMPLQSITNEQLVLELIPDPDRDLRGWESFAHTINGYDVMGGFEPCAELANSGSPATLTELRCSLFFEARRDRHSGGLSTDEEYIRDLLRAIRQKLSDGELD